MLAQKVITMSTVYDVPIDGSLEAIKFLYDKGFKIIIYSCKSRSDRPSVRGKNGTEMIWDWLGKYNVKQYVTDVVSENQEQFVLLMIRVFGLLIGKMRFHNWRVLVFYEDFDNWF